MDFGSAWKDEIGVPNFGHMTNCSQYFMCCQRSRSRWRAQRQFSISNTTVQFNFNSVECFSAFHLFILKYTTRAVLVQCHKPVLLPGLLPPASIFVAIFCCRFSDPGTGRKRFQSYKALIESSLVIDGKRWIWDFRRRTVWSHFRSL